jgi:hypothetical protein
MLFEAMIDLGGADAGEGAEAMPLPKRTAILSQVAHALSGLGYSAAAREQLKLRFRREMATEALKQVEKAVGKAKVGGKSVVETVREALGIE